MIEAKDLDSLAWKAAKVKQLPASFEFSVQAKLCIHTSRIEFFSGLFLCIPRHQGNL